MQVARLGWIVDEAHVRLVGQRADERQRVGEHAAEMDRLERQRHRPGLDPRDVEHLVDELEQVPAGLDDLLDGLVLVGLHVVEREQLAEADDRVERGAQLVAHAREELVLGLVCALDLRARGVGAALGVAPVGDVLGDAEQIARLALLVADRDLAGVQEARAVCDRLERLLRNVHDVVAGKHGTVGGDELIGLLLGEQLVVVLAHELLA